MKEQGLPKLVVQTWYGLFAPAGTPAAIIAKLNSEMNVLLGQVEVGEVLARQDMIAVGGTPERFATLVSTDLARWARVVAAANIKAD
jgi:tripartite-type tricarboxylate transporter receptor subunit TctC